MSLINCEISLALTWSANYIMNNSTGIGTLTITYAKLDVLLVSLATKNKIKLLQQFKLDFKCTLSRNNFQSNAGEKSIFRLLNRSKFSGSD